MKVIAILPARMAATRFPNKPLKKILGIPMIGHVYLRTALSSIINQTYVATCDQEIMDYIQSIDGKSVMTKNTHERCTDRTAEALNKIQNETGEKFDVVAMIQGDEPMVHPDILTMAVRCLQENPDIPIVNVVAPIKNENDLRDGNIVKIVTDLSGKALYFSREPIPTLQKGGKGPWLKQTGLIFFRTNYLKRFNDLPSTPLEQNESIDMMRVLEHGDQILTIKTDYECLSIDTDEDLKKVEAVMSNDPLLEKYRKPSQKTTKAL